MSLQPEKKVRAPVAARPTSLLIADRDAALCQHLSRMLPQHEFDVQMWSDPSEVRSLLRNHHFGALLIGIDPQEEGSHELLARLREEFSRLPILAVTPRESSGDTTTALEAGASDVVSRKVSAPVLRLRLHKALDYERISRLADTDDLTRLPNRRVFDERLLQEIQRASRYKHELSLMLADIDHFKRFNDAHGHQKGDEVLMRVARIFKAMTRTSDLVARYGGEEFAVILPETSARKAKHFGERIRVHVANSSFDSPVTLSAGVATWEPKSRPQTLVEDADSALYEAKRRGRNRIIVKG
jgi:two-component system cell cycle response regulator